MNEIIVGILILFVFIVFRAIKGALTESEGKRNNSERTKPYRPSAARYKPQRPKVRKVPQQPSPMDTESDGQGGFRLLSGRRIAEKGTPYLSKSPPEIPKHVPKPFDYQAGWWKKYSTWYRDQRNWTCEVCQISLNDDRYYLHTHHIWGTQYNDPKDLMALCIACHSEQPGRNHNRLKESQEYQDFMRKYGKQWRFRRYN